MAAGPAPPQLLLDTLHNAKGCKTSVACVQKSCSGCISVTSSRRGVTRRQPLATIRALQGRADFASLVTRTHAQAVAGRHIHSPASECTHPALSALHQGCDSTCPGSELCRERRPWLRPKMALSAVTCPGLSCRMTSNTPCWHITSEYAAAARPQMRSMALYTLRKEGLP